MKIGLITDSVSHLPFEAALDLAQHLGLSSVEVATGNWSEAPHADLDALVSSEGARGEFIGKMDWAGPYCMQGDARWLRNGGAKRNCAR